jgi:LPXTG-motif cell wall-anchored protein
MNQRLSLFAAAVVAATAVVLSVGAPASAAEGSFSPTTIRPGDPFQVSFSNEGANDAGGDDQCDDQLYDYDDQGEPIPGSYSVTDPRPLWIGFIPGDLSEVPADELIDAYYELEEAPTSISPGFLPGYVHENPDISWGWVGEFDGSGLLPDLAPGTYSVLMTCGYSDGSGPDGNGTPVFTLITVTGSDPAIDLDLELILDQTIDGGGLEVPVEGSGLLPGADYTVTLRSNPVVIGTGIVSQSGTFAASYPIPADTPDGGHSVTVDSLDTDGNPVSAVGYFNLAGGVVTGISDTTPFAALPTTGDTTLPATGGSTLPMILVASVLVLAGGVLLRRRAA